MDENQDKPKEDLSEEPQIKEILRPKYREISEEELKEIFENHKKYFESEGKAGKKDRYYRVWPQISLAGKLIMIRLNSN